MSPRTPRDVSGKDIVKMLTRYGYDVIRQSGSHIRMSITTKDGVRNITIPNHGSIRLGTLMSIVTEVSEHLNIPKEDIINKL
jgi:predicted RNA binding protein YcfA (HicA-like mRNA interferase family)